MTAMTLGQRICTRAVGLSCLILASVPASAFAQAQSPACAKASMFHAAHNTKEANKWDRLCRISSVKAGNGGGASAQEAERAQHLAQAREAVLAKQRADAAQRPPQQQAQPSYQSYSSSPNQAPQSVGSIIQRLQADRARRQALLQQQQQQQQQQMPAQAPQPAYVVVPVAAPAPSAPPASVVVPVSDESSNAPDPLDAVLTPGLRDTSLVNDQTVAAKAKTDLGVFGVTLGDSLVRPKCGRVLAQAADPCVAERGSPTLVASLFNGRIAKLSDFTNVPIHLPENQCPEWLKAGACDVVLAISSGYVYAAFMVVGGEDSQTAIETALAQKYGKKADKGAPSQCKKDGGAPHPSAPLRSWTLRGMRVEYDPYGATCASGTWRRGTGQLVVETDTFRRMVTEAGTTAEPKM